MSWVEMAVVALLVDLALILTGLLVIRRTMRRMLPPGMLPGRTGATQRARKERVGTS